MPRHISQESSTTQFTAIGLSHRVGLNIGMWLIWRILIIHPSIKTWHYQEKQQTTCLELLEQWSQSYYVILTRNGLRCIYRLYHFYNNQSILISIYGTVSLCKSGVYMSLKLAQVCRVYCKANVVIVRLPTQVAIIYQNLFDDKSEIPPKISMKSRKTSKHWAMENEGDILSILIHLQVSAETFLITDGNTENVLFGQSTMAPTPGILRGSLIYQS